LERFVYALPSSYIFAPNLRKPLMDRKDCSIQSPLMNFSTTPRKSAYLLYASSKTWSSMATSYGSIGPQDPHLIALLMEAMHHKMYNALHVPHRQSREHCVDGKSRQSPKLVDLPQNMTDW